MTIPNDWDDAARVLEGDVREGGGFVTLSRDELRSRFGIGRLTDRISEALRSKLNEYNMIVFPDPYQQGTAIRVYDLNSDIGKIALAILDPENVTERALVDAVKLHDRAEAALRRRSESVPWLSAFNVFLQIVRNRQAAEWEELDDEREPFQLVAALAECLNLPADIVHTEETKRMADTVWSCRPRLLQWEGAPEALAAILADAARNQKNIFDGMLSDAAKHLLKGVAIPSGEVDLGRLGLRYRRKTQGEI